MTANMIFSLGSDQESLDLVGGKGRSLTKLVAAGFNVPPGFQITTDAYHQFINENDLQPRILESVKPQIVNGICSFEQASEDIVNLFHAHDISDALTREINTAYQSLGKAPRVAVRSSANAEDLPDLSFAGQQETYLQETPCSRNTPLFKVPEEEILRNPL